MMEVKLIAYEHSVNGLSLFVIPKTDVERDLLKGLWKHGRLETCNGVADGSQQGFCIAWKQREANSANDAR